MWKAHGLETADQAESIAFCEKLFAENLAGEPLMTDARHLRGSAWLNFQRVACEQWWLTYRHGSHVVLMGDAVHTAHFAIGSGTKLAIEDAIELTRQFQLQGDTPDKIGSVLTHLPGAAPRVDAAPAERSVERDGVVRGLRQPLLRPAAARAVHVSMLTRS